MLKNDTKKYKYGERFLSLNELYRREGKWRNDPISGIKYKSIEAEILDVASAKKIE